jgi:hypothetical protein
MGHLTKTIAAETQFNFQAVVVLWYTSSTAACVALWLFRPPHAGSKVESTAGWSTSRATTSLLRATSASSHMNASRLSLFAGQALDSYGNRSMADIQLKTVSSCAQLQYFSASCSPAVGRLRTTPDTLPQSRSVTATRLTTSSTVVLRPKERLILSMTHHTHAP